MHNQTIKVEDPLHRDWETETPMVSLSVNYNGDYSGLATIWWKSATYPTDRDHEELIGCEPLITCTKCDWGTSDQTFLDGKAKKCCPDCSRHTGHVVKVETGKYWALTCVIPGVVFKYLNRNAIVNELIALLEDATVGTYGE